MTKYYGCSIKDCSAVHYSKSFCKKHYTHQHWIEYASPVISLKAKIHSKLYNKFLGGKELQKTYSLTPVAKILRKKYETSEKRRKYKMKYRKTKKGKMIERNRSYKRRSKKKQTDITIEWLLQLREETILCSICQCLLEGEVHLDHVIPLCIGGTHTINNVRYVHSHCNLCRPRDGSDL